MHNESDTKEIYCMLKKILTNDDFDDRLLADRVKRLRFFKSLFIISLFASCSLLIIYFQNYPYRETFPDNFIPFAQALISFSIANLVIFLIEANIIKNSRKYIYKNGFILQNCNSFKDAVLHDSKMLYDISKFDKHLIGLTLIQCRNEWKYQDGLDKFFNSAVFLSIVSLVVGGGLSYLYGRYAESIAQCGLVRIASKDEGFSFFMSLFFCYMLGATAHNLQKKMSEKIDKEKQQRYKYTISLLECAIHLKSEP